MQNRDIILTEKYLNNYKNIKISIKNMEEEIEDLTEDITSLPAITYGDTKIQSNNNADSTEQSALLLIKEKECKEKELNKNKRIIETIDIAMNNLTTLDRRLVQLKCIDKKNWKYICNQLHYGESQLNKRKRQAVKSIAVALFGCRVIE